MKTVVRALVIGFVMAAVTVAVDAVAVLVWSTAAGSRHLPPVWVLLVATVAVAAVLPPVGRWAERFANWLVYGERADSYAMMTDFVRRVADTMSVDDVLPRLAETAARSTHSTRGEVRLWLADGRQQRQIWPPRTAGGPGQVAIAVQHAGDPVGELAVDAVEAGPSLDELAGPAGLALSTVRLTVDLRARLSEIAEINTLLKASEERLVRARRSQRGRVRSDLARRVDPHLTAAEHALDTAVGVAGGAWTPDPPDSTADLLAPVGEATRAALDDLRVLAQGIFPPLLDQAGLAVALRAWADREEAELELPDDVDRLREHAAVQACFYFCCVTVLTDLKRLGTPVTASFDVADGEAGFRLSWSDGRLGASAIVDLRDRLEALGGSFVLDPAEARGRLPIDSPTEGAYRP